MRTINVKPAKLEQVAAQVEQIASEIRMSGSQMEDIKGTAEAAWKSQYAPLYTQEVEQVKRNINKLAEQTRTLASNLRSTARKIREVEAENVRRMNQNR